MSSPIKEELRRFKRLLINHSKVIVGGMILSSMFLFFYAGIRANYVSIAVLATLVSTISLSMVVLLLYVRFHEIRSKTRLENLSRRDRSENEELTRIIVQAIADLPSTQSKKLSKQNLFVVEHVLLSVFQWGRLIGKMFYYGLAMVKVESGFGKGPKEV